MLSKRAQKELKRIITIEDKYRKGLEENWENMDQRGQQCELEEAGANFVITNFGGEKGKTVTSILGEGYTSEKCGRICADLMRGIKMSKQKEKFYRYVFLEDKTNATKYHEKLKKSWEESLDHVMDLDQSGGTIGLTIDQEPNDGVGPTDAVKGEAIRLYAEEMKKSYEHREGALACLR